MKKILSLLFLSSLVSLSASVFDPLVWDYETVNHGVKLFVKKYNDKVNYYKGELIVHNVSFEEMTRIIMDYDNYSKVFPKTIQYKPIRYIDPHKLRVHCILDFSPMKNREYVVEVQHALIKKDGLDTFIFEWYPSPDHENIGNSNSLRVEHVNGRWILQKQKDGTVNVSIEYFNNFEVNALRILVENGEKYHTVLAILNLVNYHRKVRIETAQN